MPDHELSYYDLLGLTPDASHDEIRTAYDAIMVRIRPNIAHDSASTIRLAAAVKEAWEILGDDGKRRAYDESLRGSTSYADLWRRREQSPFLEQRDAWFDQQVRRAQSERQSAHEYDAERKQLKEDFEAVAASNAAVELAREASRRTEAAQKAAAGSGRPAWRRLLVAAIVVLAIIAAVIGARALQLGRQASSVRVVPAVSAAPAARASIGSARLRAPTRSSTPRSPSRIVASSTAQRPATAAVVTTVFGPTARSAPVQPAPARSPSQIASRTATPVRPRPRTVARPAYVCKTEAIASVTRDGSIVDLSDGKRYQLGDPVDRAQAGGWSTGTSVAECAWPATMNRAASLDVNGYTVQALPAAIVAAAPASTANPSSPTPACADASITDVSDDGYGVALSDGHVYAVDNAGHVTASAWLVGDAVTVCSAPARGTAAFTVARFGAVVDVSRTRSLVSSASAPTLCVVRLIAARSDDGARVTFNDGHSYRVVSAPGRSIVAAWSVGQRVTVCIKVAAGAVSATLARGSLVAGAVRAD